MLQACWLWQSQEVAEVERPHVEGRGLNLMSIKSSALPRILSLALVLPDNSPPTPLLTTAG